MKKSSKIQWLWLSLALVAGCRGCAHAPGEAPDEHTWRAVKDPYAELGARGGETELDRAARVIDAVAAQLGYGAGAGDELRARAREPWVVRIALLLAHGGDEQVDAAWIDANGSLLEALGSPADLRLLLRQSEARISDARHAKTDTKVLRRMELAELAWTCHLLARLRTDAGLPPARGWE